MITLYKKQPRERYQQYINNLTKGAYLLSTTSQGGLCMIPIYKKPSLKSTKIIVFFPGAKLKCRGLSISKLNSINFNILGSVSA